MSRRSVRTKRLGLVVLGGLAAVSISGCSGGTSQVDAAARVPPALTAPSTTEVLPPSSTPPVVSTTTPPKPSSTPTNIPATNALNESLVEAFASYQHIPVADVGATVAGSEHEAYLPSGDTYWATARFMPAASAGADVVVFQDGGNIGIFSRSSAGSWSMDRTGGEPFPCPGVLPSVVLDLWALQSADCSGG
jgi:hypothetical protein